MLNLTRLLTLIVSIACANSRAMFFPPITDNQWVLSKALYANNDAEIKRLIPCTDIIQHGHGSPVLHQATVLEKEWLVTLLLQKKVPADVENYAGQTALCKAARSANLSIAKILKNAGANINHITPHGQTPLSCAIKGLPGIELTKQLAMITWLIQEGASITTTERMPLCCSHPQEVSALLKALKRNYIQVCSSTI